MTRLAYSAAVAAMIGLGAFTLADAQGPGRRGFGGPGFGGRGLMPFARMADLTDAQREQIRAILEEGREERQGPPAHAGLHRQLQTELLADAPDEQKIETLRQQIAQASAEALTREIAVQRKIAQVLTPEQRAKAREHLAQAPQRGPRTRG